MKTQIAAMLSTMFISQAIQAATFVVPGTSNPWLAGMSNGSIAISGGGYSNDTAPAESPFLVTGIAISPGEIFSFSGSGLVGNDPINGGLWGLDGNNGAVTPHLPGPQNGIASLIAPVDSLIGVFLGPDQPDLGVAPLALDFTTAASRDYLSLSPALQQPFFIGDGFTSLNVGQQIIAPAGATRLYLGTMDGAGWYNNPGSFTVAVVPEPCVGSMVLIAVSSFWLHRKAKQ